MRYATLLLPFLFIPVLPSRDALAQQNTSQQSPRPNPDFNGIYHIGDGVTAPKAIVTPAVELTDAERKRRVTGNVVIWLTVDEDGNARNVRIARSFANSVSEENKDLAGGLNDNALKAAKQYRFRPATYQGKPVAVEVQVKIGIPDQVARSH
jgi:TonB family protein